MLHESLEDVLPYMMEPTLSEKASQKCAKQDSDIDENQEMKMSLEELVSGALESTFWAMDR